MSKQDRQAPRNIAGLEYRYSFGRQFAELSGMQKETKLSMEEIKKLTEAELSLRLKYDDNDKIVAMLNAAADVIRLKSNRLEIESDHFSLSADGKVNATAGHIGGWVIGYDSEFDACVLRSASAVYSTVSYSDGTYKPVTGYVFTVLENMGLAYVVKESLDYESTTLAKISAFQSPTFEIHSSGGGIL